MNKSPVIEMKQLEGWDFVVTVDGKHVGEIDCNKRECYLIAGWLNTAWENIKAIIKDEQEEVCALERMQEQEGEELWHARETA